MRLSLIVLDQGKDFSFVERFSQPIDPAEDFDKQIRVSLKWQDS
jgi:hypothetical protein